jgi:hypothetical protein
VHRISLGMSAFNFVEISDWRCVLVKVIALQPPHHNDGLLPVHREELPTGSSAEVDSDRLPDQSAALMLFRVMTDRPCCRAAHFLPLAYNDPRQPQESLIQQREF